MSGVFYNDNDPQVCAWLEELIRAGAIAPGVVKCCSILDLKGSDLEGFTQVHLFAGVGGWSYALRLAGWPDDRPVWTGSCPCQPFSCAGKRKGTSDERHLWPAMFRLISECHPATIFGEQVAGTDGVEWFAGVRADLESVGYAVGEADLCAAGVGSPQKRQRLYWLADAGHKGMRGGGGERGGLLEARRQGELSAAGLGCSPLRLANAETAERRGLQQKQRGRGTEEAGGSGAFGAWSDSRIIRLSDDTTRRIPIEPAFFPLAYGIPANVVRLRGYGNAIVPQVAAAFVRAYMSIDGRAR